MASRCRDLLGAVPDSVVVKSSGSVIKNVKSVIVPNTGQLKGIEAAAAAGIVAGITEKKLEVINAATDEQRLAIREYIESCDIRIEHTETGHVFDICIEAAAGDHTAKVRIADHHTNIVYEELDGKVLKESLSDDAGDADVTDRSFLCVEGITEFAESCDYTDIKDILDRQIEYNMAIAEEGLRHSYGANIGSVLLNSGDKSIKQKAMAMAAAASDARMNGCEMPVIINSGSGNQGITCSVPVIVFARALGIPEDKMYRALILSNLLTIYQKTGIGTLSAFCGAVCAGVSAAAAICFLQGGGRMEIDHTLVNGLGIVSGIVCDGAKASCAAKIAFSINAGIVGSEMYSCGQEFRSGDGIVGCSVDQTISNVGRLGKNGMKETNEEILKIMVGQ